MIAWLVLTICGADAPADMVTEKLARIAKPSLLAVRSQGRDGKFQSLGTGFLVRPDLAVTNHHVIGDGRDFVLEDSAGGTRKIIAVEAVDRDADLALLRLEAPSGKAPPVLELGDSTKVAEGAPLVALGNPRGLTFSVVAGVLSGRRTIEGRDMLQVAMPVEPGNSGGPLLDREGRVVGVITSKSLVTPNLGFAVPVERIKPLIAKPTPVKFQAWLTLGKLDPERWQPLTDARWTRSGGTLRAEGGSQGFGNRSLCLQKGDMPNLPCELSVRVKLDQESGAAGLVFCSDGKDKHYGFYPSGGGLRLTRFDGPDVYSWKILAQAPSPAYRAGDWNWLSVRVDKERIICRVNDTVVFDEPDTALRGGRAGLAKFRDTVAEFQSFKTGKQAIRVMPTEAERVAARKAASDKAPPSAALNALVKIGPTAEAALLEEARDLDNRAKRLRELAGATKHRMALDAIEKHLKTPEGNGWLARGALLLARIDRHDIDIDERMDEFERLGKRAQDATKGAKDVAAKLDTFLFDDLGFHGARTEYHHHANSDLASLLDDREGIPLTLAMLYLEIGWKLGLKLDGIGLPGHFVVRLNPEKGNAVYIDVFDRGRRTDASGLPRLANLRPGSELPEETLKPMSRKAMLARMARNLAGSAGRVEDDAGQLRHLDALLLLDPESGTERGGRAMLRARTGDFTGALADIDYLLEHPPEGVDPDQLAALRRRLAEQAEKAGASGSR